MSTISDLVLLTTSAESGRSLIGSTEVDPVLGGAVMVDLLAAGRITIDGEGRKARAHVVDASPLSDAVAEAALRRLRGRTTIKPAALVARLGKGARKAQYDVLVGFGVLQARRERVLGLVPVTRYDVLDLARHDDLVGSVRAVLLDDVAADARTGPLVALLEAANLVKAVVPKADVKRARTRAKVVAEGDWAGTAVRDAIKAAQVAVTAAVTAATAASIGAGA